MTFRNIRKMDVEESVSFELSLRDINSKSTETVLPLVRKCLEKPQNDAEVVRALETALCYCLKNFSVRDLDDELFQMACPPAKDFVLDKLKYLETNPGACFDYLAVVLKVIAYFQGVFEYLCESQKLTFIEVRSLLMATCEILHGCYSHCKTSEQVYGEVFSSAADCLSNFFKNCCSLQEQLLDFITEKAECDTEDDRELLLLEEVLIYLSKSGVVLIDLEVKTMAKVWKSYAFLIQKYFSCLRNNHNIGDTIRELSICIIYNVEAALYKPGEDALKVVKLSCFLLKLVIKFCEIFKGCLKDCQQTLLDLLFLLCRCSTFLLDKSKLNERINQDMLTQLTVGLEPLLLQLISDEMIVKQFCLLAKDSERTPEFSILCCFVLKKLFDSNRAIRSLWFNDRENILDCIFQSTSSTQFISSNLHLPGILVNGSHKKFTDIYEYTLVTTSAFLLTASSNEFCLIERTLIQNVLQSHPLRALLAIDMWCLLARFADSDLCLSQILALGKLFQEFNPGTLRPEKCYLGSLIRRLFPLLADRHKTTFLKAFRPSSCAALWAGRATNGLEPKEASDLHQALLPEVERLLPSHGTDSKCFGRTGERSLSGGRTESLTYAELGKRIERLWKFDCEVLSSSCQSQRFLKIVCNLTACIVSELPPENLLLVLSQIKSLLTINQPVAVHLSFLSLLNAFATVRFPRDHQQKRIITAISDIFHILLSSTKPLLKERAFDTFLSFSYITSHPEIISLSVQHSPDLKLQMASYLKKSPPDQKDFRLDEYIRRLCSIRHQHMCGEEEPEGTVVAKKMRMWAEDAEEVIVRWKEDGRKLVEYYQVLSEAQRREIKNVCNSIQSLR